MAEKPEDALERFISRFSSEVAAKARAILSIMRERLPGATQLVYDNYNALAIGFGPGERTSDCPFSIALYPRWVSLFFLIDGVRLPDPEGLLRGTGTKVRHIVLDDPQTLNLPGVKELMAEALAHLKVPIPSRPKGHIIIKSVSPKQRPRRP